jgi:RHH-type proline utilization regulon transcriptional repressor/proline dehydrogenase/delta 1-pyrroline-5-carboxylate dehydrogenase
MGNIQDAQDILDKVKGQPQSVQERKRLALNLAALMLEEAQNTMSYEEKKIQNQLSRLMDDPIGKAFTMAMTDQCFRTKSNIRIADQMIYLLNKMGIPKYFDLFKKAQLFAFKMLPTKIAALLIPLVTLALRKETSRVILPGEEKPLTEHLSKRKQEGVRLNLNHLGEAILSENEAKHRLEIYLKDLENPNIDYMSVKISTIFSQINLLAFDETVESIAKRLRQLYRTAIQYSTNEKQKFINLDMEEYRDLFLTVAVFKKVLSEPEFFHHSAGIVLQAYLPDSYSFQLDLTSWAKQRVKDGGAPIKIRIVKGANLAMEQFEASLKGWAQAPYTTKHDVDANFKRMVDFGCILENARCARLGIASHNLFDIAYAMLVRAENRVESYTGFEMLEGMADHIRRVVQKLTHDMLLYCPVATKEEFQHAIAYLVRRLDENTGSENFLRHAFNLHPGTKVWNEQTQLFFDACDDTQKASISARRNQNRLLHPKPLDQNAEFENEPDTDFALPQNRVWAQNIIKTYKNLKIDSLPLCIRGGEQYPNEDGIGFSPINPVNPLYKYAKASKDDINEAIVSAKSYEKTWSDFSYAHRAHLMKQVAQKFREKRAELTGIMMLDAGKTIMEADPEISEAIDFAEYYARQYEEMMSIQDVKIVPKGTCVVTPPWNFPCSIPAGGIIAALVTGNCVIFKPASDAVLVGFHVAKVFWEAGVPKDALQFVPCSGSDSGSYLIQDPRINLVILTGGTSTAKKFLQMRPNLDLAAETGGKNAIIVTALADRDLAIKDIIQSAFGHAGQKCSAASLVILEKEVYDDPHFLHLLKEATKSLKVGTPFELTTKINPLIHKPTEVLKQGLTQLDDGESWLLEPTEDPQNPCLWSPGIKLGVKPGSFSHMTELFGPVLSLMRAENLEQAIEIANMVPYGLTSGIQTLDDREKQVWLEKIEAGNLYINRGITGAIVQRQPFGGCKASSIGGGSKAGGPNYLRECVNIHQISLPKDKKPVLDSINNLTFLIDKMNFTLEDLGIWMGSVTNYRYLWDILKIEQDVSKVVGQDNILKYIPRKKMVLRIGSHSKNLDVLRVIAAALTVGANLEISICEKLFTLFEWKRFIPDFKITNESDEHFISRIQAGNFERIRMVEKPTNELLKAAAESLTHVIHTEVLASARFELLHYLREVAISHDYHRYGNLALREKEIRKEIL